MPARFMLHVISPEKAEFEGEVESLTVPGSQGYLGILANHAALLTTIGDGILRFSGGEAGHHSYRVTGGFVEVQNNEATVLVQELHPAAKV